MKGVMGKGIPLYVLIALMVVQATVVYGAVTVLYHNDLAAFGTLKFTGEVEIIAFDIYDEQTCSVVLRRTPTTQTGVIYTVGVACDNTMGTATVSWVQGDPDAKKILVQMGEPISSTISIIRLRVENSGQLVIL